MGWNGHHVFLQWPSMSSKCDRDKAIGGAAVKCGCPVAWALPLQHHFSLQVTGGSQCDWPGRGHYIWASFLAG